MVGPKKKDYREVLLRSSADKTCNDCRQTRPIFTFSTFTRITKKHGKRMYVSSICKRCKSLRSRKWMFKNPHKYLLKEKIRATHQRRKTPLCAKCFTPGNLEKHTIQGYTAFYHPLCAQSYGEITPQRKQQLLELINS